MEKPFNIEERMGKVEGVLDQIKERLNHVETEISGLRGEIGGLRGEMDSKFRWTIGIMLGIMIPMWVTIILAILFKIP